jgi:hypothetical protein
VSLASATLPTLDEQVSRLIELGAHTLAGLSEQDIRAAAPQQPEAEGALLVMAPSLLPPSRLAPLLRISDKRGFVVTDMQDVDQFTPLANLDQPDGSVYLLHDPDRGDDMANWSPNEALPAIIGRGRTPLTLAEGIHWLVQAPEVLARNHCFMTIGSRLVKANGTLDTRTPAIWISNGTGRDGAARRGAPKVGWCWAGNRHTWLGFASAAGRSAIGYPGSANLVHP